MNKKLLIVLSAVVFSVVTSAYIILSYEEPKYIDVCVESHTEKAYQPPTYINMDGIMIPVGGGMYDHTVCDKYETQYNPKYGK